MGEKFHCGGDDKKQAWSRVSKYSIKKLAINSIMNTILGFVDLTKECV